MDKTKKELSSKAASLVIDRKATPTPVSSSARPSRVLIVQNFTLVWLDSNIDESDVEFEHSLTQLRRIVNTIDTFTDADQCIDFLSEIKDEKAFMILSGALGQSTVPHIHNMSQLDSIYVFCGNKSKHEQWAQEWIKVRGVFTQIDRICDMLKHDTHQCDRDSISISVTSGDLHRLDPSFMYTQLLKETLIEMPHGDNEKKELADFCRDLYCKNKDQLQVINEFERDYRVHTPIWWYTRECFTYQMLNRALRIQEVEIIIKVGFFLRDVHRQIEELHSHTEHHGPFVVYRGQNMSNVDFEKIKNSKSGLLAFNNFLSTSLNKEVSLQFARNALHNPESVGILFKMTINPSMSSAPFLLLDNISYYNESEKEILFSMHTVFRIGEIKQIENLLWRVELALASDDDDRELKQLTEHIRKVTSMSTGWHRLGKLLIKTGNFDKAEEIYQILLEETSKDDEKELSHLYYKLGWIKDDKGDYKDALEFYQKALEIKQKSLPPNHPYLGITYSNIGRMHDNMREYSKALSFYERAVEIGQHSLPSNTNHSHLQLYRKNLAEVRKKL